jgi:hypothetical protein
VSQPHDSSDLLAATHGWYERAMFNKNGTVTLLFTLPATERQVIVDLAANTGMELNLSVWETESPSLDDVLGDLGVED